ncbi:MAG: Na/Pi cotransporter family protein [Clostridia bacterium]|nr:Na/Pi cotransporter family protein [Clostridia bacterium]
MAYFLQFLGGISFFLYGMTVMSKSLRETTGSKMEAVLARMCRTPLRGVIFGALVTAAIQSSSATTVMVVGFVDAKLMTLKHAVGVIMGANLGTTVTAWLLSLSGVSGSAPLLSVLKPETLSPVLAAVGVILLLVGKREKLQHIGTGLCGFGILFAGMEAMSNAVAPLADNPAFSRILTLFTNPFAGILAGAVLTALIQSSSASIGILQALTATGAVSLGMAVPIIMGQNIGTCITALLSGIGTERNAKRAAFVHLYFNVAGAIVLLLIFYLLRLLGVLSADLVMNEGGVALIHTVFNVATTAILLPFYKILLRAAIATVPDARGEDAKNGIA